MKFTFDDVIKFAEDAMEEKERANFEQVLALDPTLRQQVQDYYQLRRTLHMGLEKDLQKEKLEETLSDLNQQYFKEGAKVISLRSVLIRAIAAVAATILILFIWTPWKSDLYDQYAKIEMQGMTERGLEYDHLKIAAEESFNHKDYSRAAGYLSGIYAKDSSDALISFYYGVTLMQTDRLTKSRRILRNIFEGESVYKYEAAFYTGLTFLKEKDKRLAQEWLEKIPADAGNYKKAIELLKKIK